MIKPKRSVAVSWLLSYVVVLLLPMALAVSLFWQIRVTLEHQVDTVNDILITNAVNTLDRSFREIFDSAAHVIINPSFRVASYIEAPLLDDDHNQLDRAAREVRAIVSSNSYVNDYYLVLRNSNSVIRRSSLYLPENRDDMIAADGLLSPGEWSRYAYGSEEGFVFLDDGRALYIRDTAQVGQHEFPTRVIFFLDDALLLGLVTQIRHSTTMSFILTDPSGSLLLATDEFAGENSSLIIDAFREDQTNVRVGKDTYVLMSNTSKYGFNFIFVEQENVVYQLMTRIHWLFGLTLVFCLLLGGIASYYFTLRNYRQIHDLVVSTSERFGLSNDLTGNEYGILLAMMDVAAEQVESATTSIRVNRDLLWNKSMVSILRGSATPDDLSLVELDDSYYSVALCRFVGGLNATEISNRNSLARRFLNGALRKFNYCRFVEIDGSYSIVIGASSGTPSEGMNIRKFIDDILQQMNSVPGLEACISLSCVHEGMESLDLCYSEACEAMEYRIVFGSSAVIEYENIRDVASSYSYPAHFEQSLMNHIKHGDSESAREITREVLQRNTTGRILSAQLAKCLMFDLISTVLKTLSEVTLDDRFLNELRPVDRLVHCETLPQTEMAISSIIESVCERISNRHKAIENKVVEDVCRYIDENFDQVMLNLDTLADKQGLTAATLSRKFRDYAGLSVSQYINSRRLEYARQRLRETDERISAIAIASGYGSTHTFIRIFKKHEGLTPGHYRETFSSPPGFDSSKD